MVTMNAAKSKQKTVLMVVKAYHEVEQISANICNIADVSTGIKENQCTLYNNCQLIVTQ